MLKLRFSVLTNNIAKTLNVSMRCRVKSFVLQAQ
jgi:hypothetical protein